MTLCAIDPGLVRCGWVIMEPGTQSLIDGGILPPEDMLDSIYRWTNEYRTLVIEWLQCFGQPVGQDVLLTARWCGQFAEAAMNVNKDVEYLTRSDVKKHLCERTSGVTDANIRQVLIDRFGPGKEKAIGKKKTPGPLYGVKGDTWQALALAVTWSETHGQRELP